MDAKLKILKDTFQSAFSLENFIKFSKEFFCDIKIVTPDKEQTSILTEYFFTVSSYVHIATYTTRKQVLDIFAVKLKSGRSIERSRSMQRSFISKLLTKVNHDGAIVAFYTDSDPMWRLSFIRLDYEFVAGRVKTNLTPAKRYSYLVGEKEPCHTAMEQLYPIFRDENYNPTFDKIEEAFSVERVTKEFFDKYKEKYFGLKEHLDSNRVFIEEAKKHRFTSEQFAKKLMGQLAFLYFLQKKGWLGVKVLPHTINAKYYKKVFYASNATREIIPRIYKQTDADEYKLLYTKLLTLTDEDADIVASCFDTDDWGSGTKSFIRDLFTSSKTKNFFDDFLEPLFYEALNKKRGDQNYYKRFNCKIPFLNGGLFEPIENYDWEHSKFAIPNELFSNKEIKGDRDADGILDIFDRYNFTMNEDEPLEREVAVDPEMLGKIFENLLDAKDRKSKGAFYTPREIVHYMCAESLINYLVGKTSVPYDDIKTFILDGEFMKDEDYKSSDGNRRLPQKVFDNLRNIDKALENIKIADPAVGSGAFPLGMLSEIVKARNNITYYYVSMQTDKAAKARLFEQRAPYHLKWKTIQNCIFAVDIEASAVDIAKLRLWLSLIVDEDLSPSYDEQRSGENKQRNPSPLPNLDYNIMCGNSLIDEFEGIQLFDDSILNKDKFDNIGSGKTLQMSLFMDSMQIYLDELRHEQERLFGEQNPETKKEIKCHIDKIIDDIIQTKLTQDNNAEGLRKYKESQKNKTKPYFLWKLEFAKIFKDNSGFDVVIGNPPYGAKFSKKDKVLLSQKYPTVPDFESADFFVDRSGELLRKEGILSFIIPNMFMSNVFAKKYRLTLLENWDFIEIDNLSNIDIFESAKVRNCIVFFKKNTLGFTSKLSKLTVESSKVIILKSLIMPKTKWLTMLDNWLNILEQSESELQLAKKITDIGSPLGNICEVSQGLIPYDKYRGHTEEIIKNRVWHSNYPKDNTYRKELAGKDINRFSINWSGESWISYGEWLAAPRKKDFFTFERLLIREITNPRILATYTCEEFYNTPSIINCINFSVNIFFVLGIINSKLLSFYHKITSPKANKGLFPKILVKDIRKLPICLDKKSHQLSIAGAVNQILTAKKVDPTADTSSLEVEIDKLVYELYELTEEEIGIVEGTK